MDNIYIRFGTKSYRQIVGIPIGTNCAPLVADLCLFCYKRDFMTSLSVFSHFLFGFEGRMWDLILSVPDYCLSFYPVTPVVINCFSMCYVFTIRINI